MNLHRLIILLATMYWGGYLHAQVSVNTCGGNGTGTGGSISFTIGQIDYSTTSNSYGLVSQGIQKGYELLSELITPGQAIRVSIFPNPTTQNFSLKILNNTLTNLYYQLYNFQGKLLKSGPVVTNPTLIELSSLSSGTYFIHLSGENNFHQTLKILKL